MSTKTPQKPSDNLHGEQDSNPRFGINEKPQGVYDEPHKTTAGDPSGRRAKDDSLSPEELKNTELSNGAKSGASEGVDPKEKKLYSGQETPGRFSLAKLRGRFSKKTSAFAVSAVVLGGVGLGAFGFIQGPLQFLHLSQNLQKLFRNNEDLGNDRMSKTLLYALAGKGLENSRLGVVGNKAANTWEKKLLDETGMKPVYTDPGRRFVGFEIIDEKKAARILEDLGLEDGGNRNQRRAVKSVEEGGIDIVTADKVVDGNGTPLKVSNSSKTLDTGNRILNLGAADFGTRRAWIKVISQATDTHNVVGSQGARLLIKRAGVKFHPMNKLSQWTDEKRAELRKKRNEGIQNGSKDIRGVTAGNGEDTNGDPTGPDQSDSDASEETKKLIEDFKVNPRAVAGAAATPVAVAGVLCIVKEYGDNLPDYKFANIAKPMMRIGTEAVSAGDQVKSFDDFNLGSMSVFVDYMQDKEKGTSWNQSEAYLAASGREGGTRPPPEMELRNISDKPQIFDWVDDIRGLGTVCSVADGIFGLPVIRNIVGVADSITGAFIDGALGIFNTSQEDLLQSSLKIVAGQSVDPDKTRGAAYGNAAFIGTELAANDVAIAMGGGVMANNEVQELAELQHGFELEENQNKSFYAKYINPMESSSLTASIIDHTPTSATHMATTISNPLENISTALSSIYNSYSPNVYAQNRIVKDYGFKRYGFTLGERQDERFEDPYANADIVEERLEELNDRYGSCFGVKIIPSDDGGISIENGESVNIFNFEENGGKDNNGCNRPSRNSVDYEIYLRYRFYIVDSISALSVVCYYDDDCVGIDVNSSSVTDGPTENQGSSTPPASINGYTLTVNEKKHLQYIAENVLTKLEGNANQRSTIAAQSAWWALREAVLDLANPFGYSNCGSGDGNTHIGVVENCNAATWQVGIGAVQVPNWNADQVRTKAQQLNSGQSIKQILGNVAELAGHQSGSRLYDQILNSAGNVQKSLIMRDPATGITLVNRDVQPCFSSSPAIWCISGSRSGISGNSSQISSSVNELKTYFLGVASGTSLVTGDSQQLAKQILSSGNVQISPRYAPQIQSIADGNSSCNVNPSILQLIATIAKNHKIYITSLNRYCTNTLTASGASSYHYREGGGHAVDIGTVDGVSSTGGTANDLELLRGILPQLPNGSGIGQVQCRQRIQVPSGIRQFEDSCNHIHIEVPVQ